MCNSLLKYKMSRRITGCVKFEFNDIKNYTYTKKWLSKNGLSAYNNLLLNIFYNIIVIN